MIWTFCGCLNILSGDNKYTSNWESARSQDWPRTRWQKNHWRIWFTRNVPAQVPSGRGLWDSWRGTGQRVFCPWVQTCIDAVKWSQKLGCSNVHPNYSKQARCPTLSSRSSMWIALETWCFLHERNPRRPQKRWTLNSPRHSSAVLRRAPTLSGLLASRSGCPKRPGSPGGTKLQIMMISRSRRSFAKQSSEWSLKRKDLCERGPAPCASVLNPKPSQSVWASCLIV